MASMCVEKNNFASNDKFNKIKKFLNSNYCLAILSVFVVFCWAINFVYVSATLLLIYFIACLVWCNKCPVGILFPILCIYYLMPKVMDVIVFLVILGVIALSSLVFYAVRKIFVTKEVVPQKGKMFWPFVLYLVGHLLAGIIGYFDFMNMLITLAFVLLIYAFYWFCLNFLKGEAKRFLAVALVFLALIITAEIVINYLRAENIAEMLAKKHIRVGTGEINGAAIFLSCGVVACFYLAYKNKRDYLYVLLALFFDLAVFFTYSRIALFVCAIASVILFFIVARKSPNKKWLYIALGGVVFVAIVVCAIFFNDVLNLLYYYLNLGFSANGRSQLWSWCLQEFKDNPFFGIGFITEDIQAIQSLTGYGLADYGGYSIVFAHNTIIHYLTCTGVIGLLLNLPWLVKRFYIILKDKTSFKLFGFAGLLVLEICGLFDSNTTNIFMIMLGLMYVAFAENDIGEETEQTKPVDDLLKDNKHETNHKHIKAAENLDTKLPPKRTRKIKSGAQ